MHNYQLPLDSYSTQIFSDLLAEQKRSVDTRVEKACQQNKEIYSKPTCLVVCLI